MASEEMLMEDSIGILISTQTLFTYTAARAVLLCHHIMAAADRLSEFRDLVSKMPRGSSAEEPEEKKETPPFVFTFHAASARIVRSSRRSRKKIEHLSTLVRQSSLFKDPAAEIAGLIHAINDEVTKSSQALRKARPPTSSGIVDRHCGAMNSQTRIEIDQTSDAFKHVLKLRSDSVKQLTERKEAFRGKEKKRNTPVASRNRVPVFEDDRLPRPDGLASTTGNGGGAQQQQMLLIPDQTYHTARADVASDIEAQVQEIGTIFSKLTSLVKQQDEQVELIEANVEEAADSVDRATNVLVDRLNNMDATTKTAFKCAGIITATLLVWSVVLA